MFKAWSCWARARKFRREHSGLISERSSLESSRFNNLIAQTNPTISPAKAQLERRREHKEKFSEIKVGELALQRLEDESLHPQINEFEDDESEQESDVEELIHDYKWFNTVPNVFCAWKALIDSRKSRN